LRLRADRVSRDAGVQGRWDASRRGGRGLRRRGEPQHGLEDTDRRAGDASHAHERAAGLLGTGPPSTSLAIPTSPLVALVPAQRVSVSDVYPVELLLPDPQRAL